MKSDFIYYLKSLGSLWKLFPNPKRNHLLRAPLVGRSLRTAVIVTVRRNGGPQVSSSWRYRKLYRNIKQKQCMYRRYIIQYSNRTCRINIYKGYIAACYRNTIHKNTLQKQIQSCMVQWWGKKNFKLISS